jgi:hypothetical protein
MPRCTTHMSCLYYKSCLHVFVSLQDAVASVQATLTGLNSKKSPTKVVDNDQVGIGKRFVVMAVATMT